MQRFSLLFILCLILISSCTPATSRPASPPTKTITATVSPVPPTSTVTATQPTPTQTVLAEPYLSDLQMMNESSGWVWQINQDGEGRLLHTSDGAKTWTDITPEEGSPYTSFFLDDQTAWLSLGRKLLMTSDGGTTWTVVNEDLWGVFVQMVTDWYGFRFVDRDHGILDAGYTAAGAHEFYYETRDGGATWQPVNFVTRPGNFFDHSSYSNELAFWSVMNVLYFDPTKFIIGPGEQEGALELFLSTDHSATWQVVSLPSSVFSGLSFQPYDRKMQQPQFFSDKDGVLVVTLRDAATDTLQHYFYGTSDGGSTWKLDGGPFLLQDAKSDLTILSRRDAMYACGVELCKTSDSANTWQTASFGDFTPVDPAHASLQLDFISPLTGWGLIYTENDHGWRLNSRLLKTVDGGFTWEEIVPVINP